MKKIDKDWIDSKMQARAESWFAKTYENQSKDIRENEQARTAFQQVLMSDQWEKFKKIAIQLKKEAQEEQLLDTVDGILGIQNQEGISDVN